jgi:hypothetical protein
MCLQTVEKNYRPERSNWGYGYKLLHKNHDGTYNSPGYGTEKYYKIGRFYKAANVFNKIRASDGQYYDPGFHIFLKEQDVEDFKLKHYSNKPYMVTCLVRYKGICSIGKNETRSSVYEFCVIAKEMSVEREVC